MIAWPAHDIRLKRVSPNNNVWRMMRVVGRCFDTARILALRVSEQRYSPLDDINSETVQNLGMV